MQDMSWKSQGYREGFSLMVAKNQGILETGQLSGNLEYQEKEVYKIFILVCA